MPWGFWAMVLAPFLDVLAFLALEFLELEEAEFFPDAPLRTAGDPRRAGTGGCATRGFKFFEVFFELGLVVFFMLACAESYFYADRASPLVAVFFRTATPTFDIVVLSCLVLIR